MLSPTSPSFVYVGYKEDELVYLYDCPVFPMDNCSGNRATHGLKTMIDIVRRHEYNFLRSIQNRGEAQSL